MSSENLIPSWADRPKKKGRFHLQVETRDGNVKRIAIDEEPGYLLGRNTKVCAIECSHPSCSRVHACIAHHSQDGEAYIIDMKSVHGTFVDGKELPSGGKARIVIGKTIFSLGECPWKLSLQAGPAITEQAHHPGSQDHRLEGVHQKQAAQEIGHVRNLQRDRVSDNHVGDLAERSRRPERSSNFSDRDVIPAAARSYGEAANRYGSAAQKRKLLWGNKGAASDPEASKVDGSAVFGANRWDTANFTNEADKQKFIKLMGAQKGRSGAMSSSPREEAPEREVLKGEEQTKVLSEVETHFMQGLRRADGRKVGLGL